jgi:hypothetical protein
VIAFVSDVLHVYMYGCLLGRATRTRYLDTSYHGQLIYVSMFCYLPTSAKQSEQASGVGNTRRLSSMQ